MLQVAGEIPMKICAGRVDLLNFVLVEARAIKPPHAQAETQDYYEQECSESMPFQQPRKRALLASLVLRC